MSEKSETPGKLPVFLDKEYSGQALTRIIAGCFAAAVAVRIYLAWGNRFSLKPDFGLVALAARHMAEGQDYPIYVNVQAYVGTLEAAVSALFCLVFGCTEFTVSLGTALCAFLSLPVVYLWAKEISGRRAGLAALIFCLIGPEVFAFYSIISAGGYALLLFFAPALLWLSGRLINRELHNNPVSWHNYFFLGCLGGLAWWSFPLILPALLTSALLFLIIFRFRLLRLRIIGSSVGGFFLGSFPFWWWNYFNNWATFRLSRSFQTGHYRDNIMILLSQRLREVLGLNSGSMIQDTTGLVLFAGAAAIFFWVGISLLRKRDRPGRVHVVAIVLFVLLHLLILSYSHFSRSDTPRYLLPLVPVFAVMIGVAVAQLDGRRVFWVGWAALLVLVLPHLKVFPAMQTLSEEYRQGQGNAAILADFLDQEEITAVYTEHNILNFALRERFTFTDMRGDGYIPYGISGELASRVGILNNFGHAASFLAYAGGFARVKRFEGRFKSIHYDFQPPPRETRIVPVKQIVSIVDSSGAEVAESLTDRNIETAWESRIPRRDLEFLEVILNRPTEVSGFRMLSPLPNGYPGQWRVEGKANDHDPWEVIVESGDFPFYFWSGPRIFWGGRHYRLESRFEPRALARLRIVRTRNMRRWPWKSAEIQLFASPLGNSSTDEVEALPTLLEFLDDHETDRLYSDRWVANAVHEKMGGRVETYLEPSIYGNRKLLLPAHMNLTRRSAFLVRQEDAALCLQSLVDRKISHQEKRIGPWVIFFFGPDQWQPEYQEHSGLYWAGFACFKG